MAIEAARLFVSIGADMGGLKKGLKDSNNDLVSFGNSMMSVGGKMTAVITAPALLAGGAMLKIGMAAEQNRIAFETLLGSAQAAGSFLNDLQDFAASTPFQFPELVDASKRMLAFGFASEKIIPMLTTIGDTVSGLGLGSEGINRVTLAIGQMSAKGKVSAQEMMQLTEAGIPAWQYLADAMGISTAEVMKMTEQGLVPASEALDYLLAGMKSDFGGLMAKQSQTAGGALSNLQDEITRASGDIATTFLPIVKDAITGLRDLVNSFADLDPETQKFIVGLGLVAAVAGPVISVIGGIVSIGGVLITVFEGLAAGWAAWSAGLSLPTALGAAGLTPIAIGLTGVLIAVGSVVAIWIAWNEQIAKTQKAGMENNISAWANGLNSVAQSGGGARAVLQQYANGVQSINTTLEQTPWYTRMFVDQQGLIDNGLRETINVLGNVSTNYDEYKSSVIEAANTAGYMEDAEGRLYTMIQTGHGKIKSYVDGVKILSEAQFTLNQNIEKGTSGIDAQAKAWLDLWNTEKQVVKTTMEASDILGVLNESLSNAGYSTNQAKIMTENLGIALGLTTQEQTTLINEVGLYSDALAMGIISEQEYTTAMLAAKNGTLEMSEAERAALEDKVALANAARDAAQATSEQTAEMWALAESLKGVRNAEMAKILIGDLTQAIRDGANDPAALGTAIEDLGIKYGLMDGKSIALAQNLPLLSDALQKGVIPANKAAEALAALSADAADGKVNWSDFLNTWKDPTVLQPTIDKIIEASSTVDAFATEKLPSATDSITTELSNWGKKFDEEISRINNSLSKVDLASFNKAFGEAADWVQSLVNSIANLPATLTISSSFTNGNKTPPPIVPHASPEAYSPVAPETWHAGLFDGNYTSMTTSQASSQAKNMQFNNYGVVNLGQDGSTFGSALLASLM